MDRKEIQDRVVKIVCQVLKVDPATVKPDSNFIFDLGAESTQSVALVGAFEEEFKIELDGEAALSVQTVGDAVDFCRQVRQVAGQPPARRPGAGNVKPPALPDYGLPVDIERPQEVLWTSGKFSNALSR
jgi:acyl carrier protein